MKSYELVASLVKVDPMEGNFHVYQETGHARHALPWHSVPASLSWRWLHRVQDIRKVLPSPFRGRTELADARKWWEFRNGPGCKSFGQKLEVVRSVLPTKKGGKHISNTWQL